jgi:HEAT repeat protein
MFGLFRPQTPRSPLSPPQKLWLERRMSWLARTFGVERPRRATVVLPTPAFFPDRYEQTDADARALYRRVCRCMDVDPRRAELEFYKDGDRGTLPTTSAYLPGPPERILVARSQFVDSMTLVATLTRRVAHMLLVGDGHLAPADPDVEALADLLAVWLGMGVFGANSVFREYSWGVLFEVWSIRKQGALSEQMYGYAFALFAWLRREAEPPWLGHLRLNVRAVCADGLDYLWQTGDTQFRTEPERDAAPDDPARVGRTLAGLRAPSVGARLSALWDMPALVVPAETAVPAVRPLLGDADPFVRAAAAEVLGSHGPAAEAVVSDLIDRVLLDRDRAVRQAAVVALGRIGRRAEVVVPTLLPLLRSSEADECACAAWALGFFGAGAVEAIGPLIDLLEHEDDGLAGEAACALAGIGALAAPAVPALIRALEQGEGCLPATAAYVLGQIYPGSETVREALRRALRDPRREVVAEARQALGLPGPAEGGEAPAPALTPRRSQHIQRPPFQVIPPPSIRRGQKE